MVDACARPAFTLAAEDCAIVQAESWGADLARFETALSRALGTPLPTAVGETTRHHGLRAVRVAPRRFWLIYELGAEPSPLALDPELGCSLALADGRVRLRLGGCRLRDVLTKCLALDWSSPAVGPGRGAQTSFHHVPVLLIRTGEREGELIVPRSFAASLTASILDAAGEFVTDRPY